MNVRPLHQQHLSERSLVSITRSPSSMRHREAFLQQRAEICSSPSRRRQRLSDQRSNDWLCRNTPYRRNTGSRPTCAQCLVREIVHVLEDEQYGYQSCRQRWLPRPETTDRTEASRSGSPAATPPDAPAMAVSCLRGGANRPTIALGSGRVLPTANPRRQRNHEAAKFAIQKRKKTKTCPPTFLQNRILAHVKSQRPINRFRILHGRQVIRRLVGSKTGLRSRKPFHRFRRSVRIQCRSELRNTMVP